MRFDFTTFATSNKSKADAFTDKLYAWGFWPIHFSRTYKRTGETRYYIKARFTTAEAPAAKELFYSL